MTDDARNLRELDEEIARLRGWKIGERGWWCPSDPALMHAAMLASGENEPFNDPPPFSTSRALAGPLLEEMHGSVEWTGAEGDGEPWRATGFLGGDSEPRDVTARGKIPWTAICRAWVSWKRAQR